MELVGKDFKPRKSNGQFEKVSTWKVRVFIFVLFALATGLLFARTIIAINNWSEKNVIKTGPMMTFHKPIWVEERPVLEVLSPVVLTVDGEEEFSPTEEKILDRWGYRDGIKAIAIFDCGESGLRDEAFSKTSDLGVAQINWPINGDTIRDRLGYEWYDMGDTDKNLDAAYLIWDRGDGVEGNGEGNFNAWVGYLNGSYAKCFK